MAGELFADITYRGLDLGTRLRILEFDASFARIEHPAPMPVGTEITLVLGDDNLIPARVTHVYEHVAGAEHPPGMRVALTRSIDQSQPVETVEPAAEEVAAEEVAAEEPAAEEVAVEADPDARSVDASPDKTESADDIADTADIAADIAANIADTADIADTAVVAPVEDIATAPTRELDTAAVAAAISGDTAPATVTDSQDVEPDEPPSESFSGADAGVPPKPARILDAEEITEALREHIQAASQDVSASETEAPADSDPDAGDAASKSRKKRRKKRARTRGS